MAKYAVFLRGINVGGRIIKMADLRACFEKAGFSDVKTILQTGNVVVESKLGAQVLRRQIETILAETFNYPAKVQVIPIAKLQSIIKANPFANAPDNYHQYVIFFENGLEKEFASEAAGLKDEEVQAGQSVVYWKVEKGMTLKSHRGKLLTKSKYRQAHTNRNINTLNKIIDAV